MTKSKEQLDFFGPSDALEDRLEPVSSDWPPQLHALAATLPHHVRMGTSSWTFPGWNGIVYRRDYKDKKTFVARSLEEYARHPLMTTVGIDRSHYGPLSEAQWQEYAKLLPPGFRCAAKVWDEITTMVYPDHARFGDRRGKTNPHFMDPQRFRDFVAAPLLAGFRDHLGPQILQIPPTRPEPDPRVFEDSLESFLSGAPKNLFYVVELRNRRLFTPRYLSILKHYGASHLFNFWTGMPPLAEQFSQNNALPGPCTVVRLMRPPFTRFDQRRQTMAPFNRLIEEQPAMRNDVIELMRRTGARGHKLYVLVDNKAEGCSPLTIQAIAELWAKTAPGH